jgi:acyl carrier protein
MLNLPDKVINYLNEKRAPLPPISDPSDRLDLDSLGVTRLVQFLEFDCNIVIEDFELVPENFVNIQALEALIGPKFRALANTVQTEESDAQSEH